jgi:hypothetical protein
MKTKSRAVAKFTSVALVIFQMSALFLIGAAAPRVACDVCHLRLSHRTGWYTISIASFQARRGSDIVERIEGTISNQRLSGRVLDVGTVGTLNVVAPRSRSRTKLSQLPPHHKLDPGTSWTFTIGSTYLFDEPGIVQLNVSYGELDSNTLAFVVK